MYNPQIETFIHVADAGSFNKAAEELYITPTAVIKQINLLETELDLELFIRSHRGLQLTPTGESLYQDAKYMIQYSKEAIQRARNAKQKKEQIIRIGVSPMTPADFLTELWPKIHEKCPDLKYKCVTFPNIPEVVKDGLKNMGRDIDIIAGLYDENFLKAAGCAVLPLGFQPVRCGVSVHHRLAGKEKVTKEDLHGEKFMMIYKGWNCELDKLRMELQENHPQIEVEDFQLFDVEIFNRCQSSNDVMVACDLWIQAHPLIKILPADWEYKMKFGLFHAPEPSETVQRFLDAVESIKKRNDKEC